MRLAFQNLLTPKQSKHPVSTMIEFLQRIVAPNGLICVATPSNNPDYPGFLHYKLDSPSKTVWLANKLSAENKDVYFAIGTLREKFVEVRGKRRSRCAENILAVKALILDLDVGSGKAYPTQADAVRHLKQFLTDTALPTPMLVSSGYGIHVYWPFTVPLAADQWQKLASKFKTLVQAYGLKADPSRTADVASILRLPGTFNFKDPANPQAVRVLSKHTPPDTPPRALAKLIIAACEKYGAAAPQLPRSIPPAFDSGLGSFEFDHEPVEFKPIAKRCQVLRAAVQDQANTTEPVWFGTLQLVRHCNNADKLAHAVSFKHPTYSAELTTQRMERLANESVGPTLCETLNSRTSGGCAGCPHYGTIKSPIQLGHLVEEAADTPSIVVEQRDGTQTEMQLPKPPFPFIRTSAGSIAMMRKDENGNPLEPEVIYAYDMVPTKRMYDEVDQCELFFFKSWLPQDGWREYPVPAHLIYDERKLMEVIAKQGVLPDMEYKSVLVKYMLGYIQTLQKHAPADQIYSQFGWRRNDSEIVIGSTAYTATGTKQVKINDQFRNVVEKFDSAGTLDAWKRIANVYNQKGYEDYAFVLMMGFGQLAFKFFGYEGGIINLHGPGGSGKSTVLRLIHSIYGRPTEKSLLHQDTNNAKMAVIGCYNNLPVTYDEITNIDPWELSDLTYAVSNGRGKEALRQDRTLRANATTWQTTMYCTSNAPLIPKLTGIKGTNSGETLRVLERTVSGQTNYDLNAAREIFTPLDNNYGLAGGIIADWLVRNVDLAKQMAHAAYDEVASLVEAESPERFWVAMCAQAVVGAKIGRLLGLHSYEPSKILAHAKAIIYETRGVIISDAKTPTDILVEYLNSHVGDTIVTAVEPKGSVVVIRPPVRGMMIRHDLTAKQIYIVRGHLKAWCVENNHDLPTILKHIKQSGALLADRASKSLGEGTEYVTGKSSCYLISADHEMVSGIPTLVLHKAAA